MCYLLFFSNQRRLVYYLSGHWIKSHNLLLESITSIVYKIWTILLEIKYESTVNHIVNHMGTSWNFHKSLHWGGSTY